MYCNSIYEALTNVAGFKDKKLVLTYLYGLFKARDRRIISKDPIIDEGQNVYVEVDRIGRTVLEGEEGEKKVTGIIQGKLSENEYTPLEGTVEETVLKLFKRFDFNDAVDKIGTSLAELVRNPNFPRPIEEIGAGQIQRYEQRAIQKKLSEYLK